MPGLDDGQNQSHRGALKCFERGFKAKEFYSITEVGVWSLASLKSQHLSYYTSNVMLRKKRDVLALEKSPKFLESWWAYSV